MPVTILADQKPEIVVENVLAVKNKKFEAKDVSLGHRGGEGDAGQDGAECADGPAGRQGHNSTTTHGRTRCNSGSSWLDEKGQKFQSNGFNWNNGTPTSVQGTFIFGDPTGKLGKPAKLTYYGWVTVQHQVEFEFHDLPLP